MENIIKSKDKNGDCVKGNHHKYKKIKRQVFENGKYLYTFDVYKCSVCAWVKD